MKIVINAKFGGFSINNEIAKKYGFDKYDESRTNPKLIELIESGVNCDGECALLVVEEIPDDATDYIIEDYDGVESIIYVINGKILRIR